MSDPWIAPDLQVLLERLPDRAIVGLTLYGEASAEPIEGIVAVANVIQHRAEDKAKRWPQTLREVCLQRSQFSTWNVIGGERNYRRLVKLAELLANGQVPEGVAFAECAFVAAAAVQKALRDRCKGSNHYHALRMQPRPSWAQPHAPTAQIGGHLFYKL